MSVEHVRCPLNDWCVQSAGHGGPCIPLTQHDLAVWKGGDPKPVKQPKKGRR